MTINFHNAKFILSAVNPKQFPKDNLPEVVFVGRSNVGKSSIINALLNRKNLAYVGNTPGKTRQINFFNIDEKMLLVDLPGYSFSRMSKQESDKIGKIIDSYMSKAQNIKLVVMLVDIRHKPSKDDRMMYEFLINSGLDFIIVPTKSDKIAVTKIPDYVEIIKEELNVPEEIDIHPISSTKKHNIQELLEKIVSYLG